MSGSIDRNTQSIVVKVDFDLTMSVLAHNLYRLLALDLPGFEHNTAQSLYEKFINNEGKILCTDKEITVKLKKKRRLPLLLEALENYQSINVPWTGDRKLKIEGAPSS